MNDNHETTDDIQEEGGNEEDKSNDDIKKKIITFLSCNTGTSKRKVKNIDSTNEVS